MKKEKFTELFSLAFDDPAAWRDWFIGNCADDEYIYLDSETPKAAATLLMQPYSFLFHGSRLATGYISCVATHPESRSRGLATKVLKKALRDAREKGYAMCELIPAEDHLYFFYDRLNFATVFYVDREHYTSLHSFGGGKGTVTEPGFALLHGLELRQGCGIIHSEADYANILHDMELDGGAHLIAVSDTEPGAAMLFATEGKDHVTVKCLLADSEALATTALAELRRRVGEKAITVTRPPLSGSPALLRAHGMARIVNPVLLLGAMAKAYPELKIAIRITDHEIPENDGTYVIADRRCTVENDYPRKPDLDITPSVLAAILFSSHKAGEIFNIPSRRPFMALMLD